MIRAMVIHDTLTGKKKTVIAPKSGPLKMFVCGPTVYNYTHIGHARTYIVFDVLARWLRYRLFDLFYLQNITDVDDKIPDPKTARRFEKEYLKSMKALHIESVDNYARASNHLKEMISQIKILLDKGCAYQTDAGIYFEVKKFPRYGQLSKQNLNKLRPGWRIEPDPQKKDPLDFALWKFEKKLAFPSPWGPGRPGWHIEDTAISEKYFGPQYDLHGAAMDLKFPHHESEIAQQESASGKKPMVKIWLHSGLVLANGEKMAKSSNNFVTVRDFLKKHPANALRLLVLNHHYRSPVNYTEKLVSQQKNSLSNIGKFMRTLSLQAPMKQLEKRTEKEFNKAMDSDLNTPEALAALFDFMAKAPKAVESRKFLSQKLDILGIIVKLPAVSAKIVKLLSKRERCRKNQDFEQADKIRKEIQKQGFFIED